MMPAAIPPISPEHARAYAALYRTHFAFVWRSLRRLGVEERELPDGSQDVFLIVFRRLSELDLEGKLTTWLYAVCLRVASDWRRRAHRRHELVGVPDQLSERPATGAHVGELRDLLWRALDAMPMDQRAVFVAFELEGMTGDEIGTALALPTPTVHSRLRLARARFRAVIERERAREGKQFGGAR